MNICPSAIDGREVPDEKRLREPDGHVLLEGNPDLPFDHRDPIPQCPGPRVKWVVPGVGDGVRHGPLPDVARHLA